MKSTNDGSVSDVALRGHVAELHEHGFTILDQFLSPSEIDEARSALDALFAREAGFSRDRGWHTASHRVVQMLPVKAQGFHHFYLRPRMLMLAREVLGSNCILSSLNGMTMVAAGLAQPMHIDQEESVPGVTIGVNAICAIDDFTKENGATRLVPGTHNRPWTPADAAQAEAEAVQIEMPAGSALVIDCGLWHAGSANRTARLRRVVHTSFVRHWVSPEWDFRRSLSPEHLAALTGEQRELFGCEAGPSYYDRKANRQRREPALTVWQSLRRRLARFT